MHVWFDRPPSVDALTERHLLAWSRAAAASSSSIPHLLNLDEVATLRAEPSGGYLAVTRSGAEVPVSRAAARELRRRLGL